MSKKDLHTFPASHLASSSESKIRWNSNVRVGSYVRRRYSSRVFATRSASRIIPVTTVALRRIQVRGAHWLPPTRIAAIVTTIRIVASRSAVGIEVSALLSLAHKDSLLGNISTETSLTLG